MKLLPDQINTDHQIQAFHHCPVCGAVVNGFSVQPMEHAPDNGGPPKPKITERATYACGLMIERTHAEAKLNDEGEIDDLNQFNLTMSNHRDQPYSIGNPCQRAMRLVLNGTYIEAPLPSISS